LSKVYDDPTQAQTKVKEVIDILKEAEDERDVENQLVLLLGFNQFDLIKLLRSNRQLSMLFLFIKNQATNESVFLKNF
jgi:pre-mRNA-splicing helicase BRR2